MRCVLRWIGWGLVGLFGLVVLALLLLSIAGDIPSKDRTVWIDGPGDTRIRGDVWVTSDLFDDSVTHVYTEVAADGTETPIGEGPRALDIAGAELYENGQQAELVVLGSIYRRDHSGRWSEFRAHDQPFVYRHYASGVTQQHGDSWYYAAAGITCWIGELDQSKNRLVSNCHFPARVRLVFRRASYDAPWVLDEAATFAETPPPKRVPFPASVQGRLTTLRIEPTEAAAVLLEAGRRLEHALADERVRTVSQVEFVLEGLQPTDLAMEVGEYQYRWRARGGWLDDRGWPVVFWDDHPLGGDEGLADHRGQPWDEAWLLESVRRHKEGASYLTYLELHTSEDPKPD